MRAWMLIAVALMWGCSEGVVTDDDTAMPDDDSGAADDDDAGDDDAGDDDTTYDPPDWCEEAQLDTLQDVTTTPAATYFVHHPASGDIHVPIVVFLPGGNGQRGAGEGVWNGFLAEGAGVDSVRAVIPYAADGNMLDEYDRSLDVVAEVIQCYGGDVAHVHLGGTSNGGMGAFSLMLDAHETFATLLGAPGVFSGATPSQLTKALSGKAVFNGVGELDSGWLAAVEATHNQLVSLGIDSTYEVFEGQGHLPNQGFDKAALFDFWLAH